MRTRDLIRANLGPMLGKRAEVDVRVAIKDRKAQVGELGLAAWVKEIRRLINLELLQSFTCYFPWH